MKDYIEERAVEIAYYIIENKATVRQTAKAFGVSKSTIHKDVTERLLQVNPSLAAEARKILDLNKSERHIRGGLATREKYLHLNTAKKPCFPSSCLEAIQSNAGCLLRRHIFPDMPFHIPLPDPGPGSRKRNRPV